VYGAEVSAIDAACTWVEHEYFVGSKTAVHAELGEWVVWVALRETRSVDVNRAGGDADVVWGERGDTLEERVGDMGMACGIR
jgi:hypothetical protein